MICHRPSCGAVIAVSPGAALRMRKRGYGYCSRRCAVRHRIDNGWRPETSINRPDVRARACPNGARAAAEVRRRKRRQAVAEKLKSFLSARLLAVLDGDDRAQAYMMAALYKAYDTGLGDERRRVWHEENRT